LPFAASWSATTYVHTQTFALRGAHKQTDCVSCHPNNYSGTQAFCFGCHEQDFQATVEPAHAELGFTTDCEVCHNETRWEGVEFDHFTASGFALEGAHLTTLCVDCHVENQLDLPDQCIGCHLIDYNETTNPNHAAGSFPDDCTQCHTLVSWAPATFNHNLTAFPLTGHHTSVSCESCHQGGQYTGTPSDCYSCHLDDYNSVSSPNHVTNNFDTDCTLCHSTGGWSPSTFNHSQTQFPLTGAHITVDCVQCHAGGYTNIPTDCYSCHADDYNNNPDPNHVTNGFSHDCTECHTTAAWVPTQFDHNQTQFPLTGAHTALACVECHANGYNNMQTDCYSCHADDYNNNPDPNHVANGFSHDCTECHTTSAWVPTQFDHNQTQFPLTGAHTPLACVECHANGYNNMQTDCYWCHEANYNGAQDPNHVSNNFDHDCTGCHNTAAWSPSTFDHNQTLFPLTGAHLTIDCVACHATGYGGNPTDCFSCHEGNYNSVTDPDHNANGFSHDCTVCHTTTAWLPVHFDHGQTQFPLTGAHVGLDCVLCHSAGYNNTPTDCWSCHEANYNSVTDPNHVTNNFDHDCTICHNTSAWSPAQFDHSQTQFPLTGAHTNLACVECHAGGYQNTPTDCYSCHSADFNGVQDPNHVSNNFSHDCTECHNTTAWSPAQFDHSQTQFPLTGAHVSLACIACHANGYENTPTDCYACHAGDYNSSNDPPHLFMGFPTNCTMCHTTFSWNSNWNHDGQWFPIFSGRHQGEWNNCDDCHVIPNNYVAFECIFCHAHSDRQNTDDQHDEVPNYSYNSQACYNCHPDGERP